MLAPLILFFLITMITVTKNDNSHQFPNKPSHPEKIKVVSIPLWKHLTMKSCSVLASGCRCSQQNIIVTTAVLISLCSCLLFFFFPSSPVFLFLLLSAYLHVSPVSTFFFWFLAAHPGQLLLISLLPNINHGVLALPDQLLLPDWWNSKWILAVILLNSLSRVL